MNALVSKINLIIKDQPFDLVKIGPEDTFVLIESVQQYPRSILIIHTDQKALTHEEILDEVEDPVPCNVIDIGHMKFFAFFMQKYNEGEFRL